MIGTHQQTNTEAEIHKQAKIVTGHLEDLTQEAEARGLNTTNNHL